MSDAARPAVYGHRGSVRPGPENTPGAVRTALAAGADGVEVDLRRGGVGLVVSHDHPNGPVPDAHEILDAAAGGRIICEVKNVAGDPDFDAPRSGVARALVALLDARDGDQHRDDVVVSSFDWFSLDAVRELGGPPTAFLTPFGMSMRAGITQAREHGHAEVHPHWSAVTRRGVESAHEAGLRVVTWTVTTVVAARRLARLGVDGLICDDPAGIVAALRTER
ncbi:MAG TPA: glycerophosphodiester phosphodiesterase [Mycobacteriales bacterium]